MGFFSFFRTDQPTGYSTPLRRLLVDAALVSIIMLCVVGTHSQMVMSDEIKALRVAVVDQMTQTRTAIQLQGKDLAASATKLSVNSSVLIDRIDTQLTHARMQIHDVAQTTQTAGAAETKKIQQTLETNLAPATTAIISAAKQVEKASQADDASLEPVVVQPAPVIVQTPEQKTVTNSVPPSIQSPAQGKKRRSLWKRFWTILTFGKR